MLVDQTIVAIVSGRAPIDQTGVEYRHVVQRTLFGPPGVLEELSYTLERGAAVAERNGVVVEHRIRTALLK